MMCTWSASGAFFHLVGYKTFLKMCPEYLFLMAHHCKCCYKIDILYEINNIVVVIIQHAEEIILCSLACGLRKDRKTGGVVRRNVHSRLCVAAALHLVLTPSLGSSLRSSSASSLLVKVFLSPSFPAYLSKVALSIATACASPDMVTGTRKCCRLCWLFIYYLLLLFICFTLVWLCFLIHLDTWIWLYCPKTPN